MAKAKKANGGYNDVLQALSEATGLTWSAPPKEPSLLKNGYFVETEMVRAPHLVRHLKDAAIDATGRPRAIVFERSGMKNASVNIPKEIAENEAFLGALARTKIQGAKAAEETRAISRPTQAPRPKRLSAKQLSSQLAMQAAASGNSAHPQIQH
jgi:hypothetical protein